MTRPFATLRLSWSDYYRWDLWRLASDWTLKARARQARTSHEAVVLMTDAAMERWRAGDFATPYQREQVQ